MLRVVGGVEKLRIILIVDKGRWREKERSG